MLSLFPDHKTYPAGFQYVPDFITADQEQLLVSLIAGYPLKPMIFHGYEAKRKTISFGYDYHFDSGTLSRGAPIPTEFQAIITQVAEHLGIDSPSVAEVLLTEYPVGAVINWHRDAPPFDRIIGISLNSDCTFRLRPHDKALQGRKSIIAVPVKRRSLYILEGDVRRDWQHSTLPVERQRFSITMRTLRDGSSKG